MPVKKIVLLGPESSGKSTMTEVLARHFSSPCLKETARVYLEQRSGQYDYDDLALIAGEQIREERAAEKELNESGFLFLDTNVLMIQVWSEIVFGRCDNRVLNAAALVPYDLYLLCRPDIPWQPDPLREHPSESDRRRIFHHYLNMLQFQHIPFVILHGSIEERLSRAAEAIRSIGE